MIVVTGSSGFIGAAIMRAFGDDAIGIQRHAKEGSARLVACDLTDTTQVQLAIEQLKGERITHFIHAAAVTPWSGDVDFTRDLVMAASVKEMCDKLNIPHLVLLSGWNVYQMNGAAPFSEKTPIEPVGDYGASKYKLEEYFRSNMSEKSLLNLRLASVYGEGQLSAGLIPNLTTSALTNGSVAIQGVATRRDYLYIGDLVKVMQQIISSKKEIFGDLNIGSGHSVSVSEIAQTIKQVIKEKWNKDIAVQTPSDPKESEPIDNQLDITKARGLGLLDMPTAIGEGLSRYIEWRHNENIL